MKEKLAIDQLVKEQNYKGLSAEKVDQLIEAIGIEEPIEDLLKMI